jgi:inhibitor of cysteine peptidase
MSRRLVLARWLLVPVLCAACSTGGSFQSDRVLTAADAGMVLVRIDDQFSVKLDASPTTGFAWHVRISNEGMRIRQGEPVYVPSPAEASAVGVGGTEIFTYRVVGSGETDLRFEYRRSFENAPPAKVVTFSVVVN